MPSTRINRYVYETKIYMLWNCTQTDCVQRPGDHHVCRDGQRKMIERRTLRRICTEEKPYREVLI